MRHRPEKCTGCGKPLWRDYLSTAGLDICYCVKNSKTLPQMYDEAEREIERLRTERDSFYMEYRVKCDEETKAHLLAIERLRAERDALRAALESTTVFLNHCWTTDVQLDEYSFERLERLMGIVDAALRGEGMK